MSEQKDFVNPIDPDKVVDNPGLIEFAHHVGSAAIQPVDRSKIMGRAMTSMYEQTDMQLDQLKRQMQQLLEEANKIQLRKVLSEKIYSTKLGFKPLISKEYYLYQREDETYMLSMVAPQEWGRSSRLTFVASAILLSDYTWDIQDKNEDLFEDFVA